MLFRNARIVWLLIAWLIAPQDSAGQIPNIRKLTLDSLRAKEWHGNAAAGFNFNRDDDRSFFLTTDASTMYTSRRHSLESISSAFYKGFREGDYSNRAYSLLRWNMFRFHAPDSGALLKERLFNPDMFVLYQFDGNRGIRRRVQAGANLVLNLSKLGPVRLNTGAGLFYEWERWRIFDEDQQAVFDSLPAPMKELIREYFGMDSRFRVPRQNVRLNYFVTAYGQWKEWLTLNAYFGIHFPFRPPYRELPPSSAFPDQTKLYPRYTLETVATLHVTKRLGLQTRIYFQHDKGQIAPFAVDEVFNMTQGLTLKW